MASSKVKKNPRIELQSTSPTRVGLISPLALDRALFKLTDRQQTDEPRQPVQSAFAESIDKFDDLYKELAN